MAIKVNEGRIDRILRIVFGVIFLLAGAMYVTAPLSYLAYLVGIILLFTGLSGFCGVYTLLGINTCGHPLCDYPAKKPAKRPKKPSKRKK
jgi:hypothetical protein